MTVLVGYASVFGSTREIADRLGRRLRGHGHQVVVRRLEEVTDLGGYDAVVAGSAVHQMAWMEPAATFVDEHRDELAELPVWLFSVGMPAALRWPLRGVATLLEKLTLDRTLRDVHARDHRLFSGVYERSMDDTLVGRLVFAVVAGRYGDYRDWEQVDAWADQISAGLPAPRPRRSTRRGTASGGGRGTASGGGTVRSGRTG
ncbi:MAG TPA: flavodoxin domain-containing protein [Nocardioidaceae bacterium]|nr:flavodoxin domain-containing protein [Nocardioidaceae bacterium]